MKKKDMKHLKRKNEQFKKPYVTILDTFPNPGVDKVKLNQIEFTSLCPLTGQPDYATIEIVYEPIGKCLESKSLKLYLAAYRSVGSFAETITKQICDDIKTVLDCPVTVRTIFARRGGINIETFKSE